MNIKEYKALITKADDLCDAISQIRQLHQMRDSMAHLASLPSTNIRRVELCIEYTDGKTEYVNNQRHWFEKSNPFFPHILRCLSTLFRGSAEQANKIINEL